MRGGGPVAAARERGGGEEQLLVTTLQLCLRVQESAEAGPAPGAGLARSTGNVSGAKTLSF